MKKAAVDPRAPKRAALDALGYRTQADVRRSPFNFGVATGDVGQLVADLEARDPDRVPVALVRAGERWAAVVLVEDFPAIRNAARAARKP